MLKKILIYFFVLFPAGILTCQNGGELKLINIDSPSLNNNIIDYSPTRKIAVYLPPSYSISQKKYPVLYFLTGHGDDINTFLNGSFQEFSLKTSMDKLISSGSIKEMIFVLIDGKNLMDGSFYENSPVTGNWRDWVAQDIVSYIDSNFRTLAKRESRAICGHSMGGFGAVNIGMKNSETFGLIYALSPGLFDQNGLKDQGMFSSESTIKSVISKINEWKQLEKSQALTNYKSFIQARSMSGDWFTCFIYGYGAAFSPDPGGYAPFMKYPYTLENNILKCDSSLIINYESGFGGLAEEAELFKDNFLSLKDFTIDYGTNDDFKWICNGCSNLSKCLSKYNIPHQLVTYSGDHVNKIRSRIEQFMLPRLSEKFEFDNLATGIGEKENLVNNFKLCQNFPNPFNPTTTIKISILKSTHESGDQTNKVTLKIYDVAGREIQTLLNNENIHGNYEIVFDGKNLASGIYIYKLQNGGFISTKKMILLK